MVIVDASTVRLDATYTEPTKSKDDVALNDLAYTSIHYQVGTGTVVKLPQILASKPTGGGNVASSVLFPLASGARATVKFWVTATDTSGNESDPSNIVNLNVERVAPSAIMDFTIG